MTSLLLTFSQERRRGGPTMMRSERFFLPHRIKTPAHLQHKVARKRLHSHKPPAAHLVRFPLLRTIQEFWPRLSRLGREQPRETNKRRNRPSTATDCNG